MERIASFFHSVSTTVQDSIRISMRRLSVFVFDWPVTVIVVSLLFAAIWSALFVMDYRLERDAEDLFTPTDAQAFEDRDYVNARYNSSNTDRARILAIRQTTSSDDCSERLLFKNEERARESIQQLFTMYKEIENHPVIFKGKEYTLDDICFRPTTESACLVTSILDLWNYNASIIESENFNPLEKILGGELRNRFGLPFELKPHLGKNTHQLCEPETSAVSNVESFAINIIYENIKEEIDGLEVDPESREWIDAVSEFVRELSSQSSLDLYLADRQSIAGQIDDMVSKDVVLIGIGIVLVFGYTNIHLFNNAASCKAHLSIVSFIAIFMALASGFGMAQTLGYTFNQVVMAVPVLVVGLGIDDTFVIMGAFRDIADRHLTPKDRIGQTMERAGSSILITSVTDCCGFLMGFFTRIPALKAFSIYAALSILFDFVFQVTFFVAFLSWEARREYQSLSDNPQRDASTSTRNKSALHGASKSVHVMNSSSNQTDGKNSATETTKTHRATCCQSSDHGIVSRIAGTWIPAFALNSPGRWICLSIEALLLSAAVYGCMNVVVDFDYPELFTRKGSSLEKAFDLQDGYFSGDEIFFKVVTKEVETDYFYHQEELAALKLALEADPYVISPVRTWYEGYSRWLPTDSPHKTQLVNASAPNAASFNAWLIEYLSENGRVFRDNVIFSNGPEPRVTSSKIDALTVDVVGGEQGVKLLDSIRNTIQAAAPGLDPVPDAYAFLFFDGLRVIAWETTWNVILAGVGAFVISSVMLGNALMAVFVIGVVGLTDVMLFGFIWWAGMAINPVTAINLVLAVGIAVDPAAHIAHVFLVLCGTSTDPSRGALRQIGGAVLAGAFATWLAVVPWGFAEYYGFFVLFLMFSALIFFSIWHGLVILPILLSFSVPLFTSTATEEDSQRASPT